MTNEIRTQISADSFLDVLDGRSYARFEIADNQNTFVYSAVAISKNNGALDAGDGFWIKFQDDAKLVDCRTGMVFFGTLKSNGAFRLSNSRAIEDHPAFDVFGKVVDAMQGRNAHVTVTLIETENEQRQAASKAIRADLRGGSAGRFGFKYHTAEFSIQQGRCDQYLIERDHKAIDWAMNQGKYLTRTAARNALLRLYYDRTKGFTAALSDAQNEAIWKEFVKNTNALRPLDADELAMAA